VTIRLVENQNGLPICGDGLSLRRSARWQSAPFLWESEIPMTIPSSALAFMSEEERDRLLESAMARSAEILKDYMAVLDARLRKFEQRYELPSSELPAAGCPGARVRPRTQRVLPTIEPKHCGSRLTPTSRPKVDL
jgi:hypothetical protein